MIQETLEHKEFFIVIDINFIFSGNMDVLVTLKNLGYSLPAPPKSLASYVPAVRAGNLIFTSGQIPLKNGILDHTGKVGISVTLEKAGEATILCCLNALAAVATITPLESIQKIVRVGVFVASSQDFHEQHLVANFASELLIQLFGEKGRHSRFAIGVPSLPLNSTVELEMVVEVE